MTLPTSIRTLVKRLASVVCLFIFVQGLYVLGVRFPHQPAPTEVISALYHLAISGEILPDIIASALRVLIGLLTAIFSGVALGLLFAWKRVYGDYILPILELIRPIPPIAWIPIAILTFGIGNTSAYFIVFMGAFFPIFTNTYFGATSIPNTLTNTCKSYDIKGCKYFYKVLFFFTLPHILAGIRIAVGMAWMSVIASELVGAQGGLGYFIQYNRLLLRIDYIMAGMIYIGLVGAGFTMIPRLAERMLLPWQRQK